jgi:hypothetical protein
MVNLEESLSQSRELRIVSPALETELNQGGGTVRYNRSYPIERQGIAMMFGEQGVKRPGKIRCGIRKRTVKIEQYCLNFSGVTGLLVVSLEI